MYQGETTKLICTCFLNGDLSSEEQTSGAVLQYTSGVYSIFFLASLLTCELLLQQSLPPTYTHFYVLVPINQEIYFCYVLSLLRAPSLQSFLPDSPTALCPLAAFSCTHAPPPSPFLRHKCVCMYTPLLIFFLQFASLTASASSEVVSVSMSCTMKVSHLKNALCVSDQGSRGELGI